MEIKVNLKDIPSNDLPTGILRMRVDEATVQNSKSTPGAEVINVEFIVMTAGDYHNRHSWDNFSLQPQALWRLRDFVEACGVFPGPDGFRTEELIGKVVDVSLEEEEYQGRKRGKHKSYARVM